MSSKPSQCNAGCVRGIITAVCLLTSANLAVADETSAILGCGQSGAPCGSANVPISGNMSTIHQSGSFNSASVEQQAILGAYANVTSIQQNGVHDSATVTQTGSQNGVVGIAQNGSHETATVGQNGANLSVQINQSGTGSSIGVTQYGTGMPGAAAVTINTFR